jgi:ParB family transcriptional regulator, chromosome partitioning protein
MEQRKALGRGLASLIPGVRSTTTSPTTASPPAALVDTQETPKEATTKSQREYHKVPIGSIVVNPHQPRRYFKEEALQELSASIQELGLIVPLVVTIKGSAFELISGERRLRASKLAGLREVPVIVREEELPERIAIALIENIQREDLNPIEESLGYKDLMETCQLTQEEVAQKVGKSRVSIANSLRLLKLPPKIQEALQKGELSAGHAKVLLSIPEIEKQLYWAEQVVQNQWSVRDLERHVSRTPPSAPASVSQRSTKEELTLQQKSVLDGMRQALGTQVKFKGTASKGQLIIDYYSLEDLNRIYQAIVKPSTI